MIIIGPNASGLVLQHPALSTRSKDTKMKIRRPDEMQDLLAFVHVYAPNYLPRHKTINAEMFADLFEGFEYLTERTPTAVGKEALEHCIRTLRLALEEFEVGEAVKGRSMVQNAAEMFRKARKYIHTDDD